MKKNKNLPDFYTALCDKYHSHPVVLEKTLENPLDCKEIQPVKPKGNQSWIFTGLMLKLKLQYLATWCKELSHLKRPWCWEKLNTGGEGDDRGWDGWMASPTQWTWVQVSSRNWWWTGRPGVLQSMGSQRVGHDWATELNWTELCRQRTWVQRLKWPAWFLDLTASKCRGQNSPPFLKPKVMLKTALPHEEKDGQQAYEKMFNIAHY